MTDKFISDYVNQATPASTSELLIDEGSGSYKALTLAALFTGGVPLPTSSAPFYFGGASTDGSIRIYRSDDGLGIIAGIRVSGTWRETVLYAYTGE